MKRKCIETYLQMAAGLKMKEAENLSMQIQLSLAVAHRK